MRYPVKVSRDGSGWTAVVGGVDGAGDITTQTDRFADLEPTVRSILAEDLGVDESEIDLLWDLRGALGTEGNHLWTSLGRQRDELAARHQVYERDRLATLRLLQEQGVSATDAAALVRWSPRHVARIFDEPVPLARPADTDGLPSD